MCAGNLGSIFRGVSLYQDAFAGALPFAGSSADTAWLPGALPDRPYASNSRHLYLLLKLDLGPQPEHFICPGCSMSKPMTTEGLPGRDDFARCCSNSYSSLNLAGCNNLQSLNGLEGLPLKSLSLPAVKSMRGNLTFLRRMKLTSLTVTGDITSLDGIQGMPLETLTVYNCRKLLGDLSALKELPLARLSISGCGINSLNGIQRLKLTSLTLSGCNYLRSLRGLEALPLENLSAVYCANLRDISALKGSKTLTTLNLSGCSSLRDVAALRGTKLTKLNLYRCYKLSSLNGIQNLPLVEINLQGCGSLRKKDYLLLARIPTLASLRTGDEKRDDEILKRCEKLREKNR